MQWQFTNDQAIYSQLVDQITRAIVSGEFKAGEKLASVRDMAQEAKVNPNTMQKALAELERTGLVYSQRTAGRFITENLDMLKDTRMATAREQVEHFLDKMHQLGFTDNDIVEIIKQNIIAS